MYIGDYLGRRNLYSPDKLAVIDAGKDPQIRLTYGEWNDRANRLANWMRDEAGVGYRDRVAILARDGIEHLDTFFSCAKLGAIHTALNWRLHWRENLQLIEATHPKVLIFSDDFRDAVIEIQSKIENQKPVLSGGEGSKIEDRKTVQSLAPSGDEGEAKDLAKIGHYLHIEGEGVAGSTRFEEVIRTSPADPVTYEGLEAEDIACLVFTGGTTGLPKGAQISHRQICWNVLNTVIHDVTHGDTYLCVFPLFHTGGLFAYVSSQIVFGNTIVLTRQFDPAQVLDLIEKERVTIFAAVPTMYQLLTLAPNWAAADLSSLRFCTSGGAPLPVPLVQKYTAEKGIRFKQGFGMTEYGPGLFALPPEDAVRKAGSIGRPNFFVDVRVVDEDNRPLRPNEPGELVLKGPSGSSGYWGDPEASAEAYDEEGWFHTGDIVEYDDEWYFYVRDRVKDMFISGGENVYPVEIEQALYRHSAVHMCAVVGVPDPNWGEVGAACVVLKPGAEATGDELIEHIRGLLAGFKIPKRVVFMDALPLSGMGKILKRELRALLFKAHPE